MGKLGPSEGVSTQLPLAAVERIRLALCVPPTDAWGFELDGQLLAAWIQEHGHRGTDPGLQLACALFHRVPQAQAAFERVIAPKVRGALRKLGASEAEAEEHLQLARTRLLVDDGGARLASYRGVGSFEAFVTTVAVRSWTDAHRRPPTVSDDDLARLPAAVDLERALSRSGQKQHFAAAFRAALTSLSARERGLLRLSLVEGASIDALAPMYGVSRATVARWLAAARASLQRETLSRLSSSTRLEASELHGLMASVESGFDLSLRRFVVEAAEEP